MAMSKKVSDLINAQINAEMYSAYLYLAMSAHFESVTLKGFAKWFKKQSEEEMKHAMKFYGHLVERGIKVELKAIAAPKAGWKTPIDIATEQLEHEKHVTKLIYTIMDAASKENDYATTSLLKWFVDEQVEEEANAQEIVDKLKYVGTSSGGLLVLDHHLGKRE